MVGKQSSCKSCETPKWHILNDVNSETLFIFRFSSLDMYVFCHICLYYIILLVIIVYSWVFVSFVVFVYNMLHPGFTPLSFVLTVRSVDYTPRDLVIHVFLKLRPKSGSSFLTRFSIVTLSSPVMSTDHKW